MAQKNPKDQNTKPAEADRTVRLPRKGLGLEKDEPTQALQAGPSAAESTLRLKRDEMAFEEPTVALKAGIPAAEATLRLKRDEFSLEEPTVALNAGVPAAEATLRLKRDELALDEPTQALERPKLRTAMEVIDEATLIETPQAKPSVMLPDATDIPSWEETTQLFTPPLGVRGDATDPVPRPLEPAPIAVDPSDSMDETFPKVPSPVLPEPPTQATSSVLVSGIAQTEEETLVLPDMHELDELPNAMKATVVMPVMEAPQAAEAPEPMEATVVMPAEPKPVSEPMEKTMVMPVMEPSKAAETPEPMEATVIMKVEPGPAPAPMEKTMVMPVVEAAVEAPVAPEPMEATVVVQIEPKSEPMEKTVVMPVMEAPATPPAEAPMPATTLMPVQLEEPSAYLTRQGQAPWPAAAGAAESSPASTQLMSESLLAKAMEATDDHKDSALAPIPPEASAIEADSPLAKATGIPDMNEGDRPVASLPLRPPRAPHVLPGQSPATTSAPPPPTQTADQGPARAGKTVDTSIGMAVTPATLLMPVQHPLDPTTPIQRPTPALSPDSAERPDLPQPVQKKPDPGLPEIKPAESRPVVAPPSVPGYPDRQISVPTPEPKFQTHPIAMPERPASPVYQPMAAPATPDASASKLWIPAAIVVLVLIIGGIYFAFFRPSLKIASPLGKPPTPTAEPSLPVPASMQGTLAQAKAGDSKAMHMLGVSFYYGLNVPQNKAEGLRWMRKAGDAGNEKARSDLRQMEAEGR